MIAAALRSRTAGRALVLAVLASCAFLALSAPPSLHGTGIVLMLALVSLDVALVAATRGLAFARDRSLDERQAALRDLAHRHGFRLMGAALLGVVFVAVFGEWLAALHYNVVSSAGSSQVDGGIGGRPLIAALELVVMMPTLVIAWWQPDRTPDDPKGSGAASPWRHPLVALALAGTAVVAAWLVGVLAAPAQTAPSNHNYSLAGSVANGAACTHFVTGRMVGAQFGATVGMRVEVCWNGRQAFVAGDPSVPLPAGVEADPNDPFLTACGADNQDDFATVSTMSCTAATDGDGTLRYVVSARVSALPLPVATREVRMSLVVDRNGMLLQQP
jgi:hypothetical protein